MKFVENEIYFSRRFGFVVYAGASKWKFLNLKHKIEPVMLSRHAHRNFFYCDPECIGVTKFTEEYNIKTLKVLYGI